MEKLPKMYALLWPCCQCGSEYFQCVPNLACIWCTVNASAWCLGKQHQRLANSTVDAVSCQAATTGRWLTPPCSYCDSSFTLIEVSRDLPWRWESGMRLRSLDTVSDHVSPREQDWFIVLHEGELDPAPLYHMLFFFIPLSAKYASTNSFNTVLYLERSLGLHPSTFNIWKLSCFELVCFW